MMHRINNGGFRKCLLGFLLILCSNYSSAAVPKDTVRVLFVGNSYVYYNNLIQMIGLITDSIDTKIICKKSVFGGSTLGDHWNGRKGLKSRQIIANGKFDIVVIQDNSMWPIDHKDSVLYFGELFCKEIKQKGARPFLYNTWARQKTPETQNAINLVYQELGKAQGATVVPVGSCWSKALEIKKDADLFNIDGSHPSAMGSFLIALSFIKQITGKLPENYPTVYNYVDKDGESFRIMQLSVA
ncbi:MAG: hypothetical protein B7Y15_10785, partial [Bacteroidetes bacterium 24-39-8]